MNAIVKTLLEDFKRSNESRKLKLALKFGFPTAAAYLEYLTKNDTAEVVEKDKDSRLMDMVVAFDTTGSMGEYIAAVRRHATQVVKDMLAQNPGLKIKVVAFGDYCDMTNALQYGKAYQESNLTDNVEELVKFIRDAQNTSGGDGDEFYELVIKKITEETPWRKDAKKSVLLIADATPHRVGYTFGNQTYNIDWKQEAMAAAKLGIQFDTLRINPHVGWYEELSKMTDGICMNFATSAKMDQVFAATAAARGSTVSSKAFFFAAEAKARTDGDEEMIGVYKSLSTKLED